MQTLTITFHPQHRPPLAESAKSENCSKDCHQQTEKHIWFAIENWYCRRVTLAPENTNRSISYASTCTEGDRFYIKVWDAYFSMLARAPQNITLSGGAISVWPSSSGLTILIYVSWPRYHLSRFSTLRFHTPTLSREIRIAVHPPG